MAYSRRNISLDIAANRAWTADAFADLATIPARHGDIAFSTAEAGWYLYSDDGTWHNLTNIATAIQGSPGAVTDHAIVRWNGTGGTSVQDSGITIADGATGALSGTNSGDVSLSGSYNYISLSGQTLTRHQIDILNDVAGYASGTWTPTLSFGGGSTGLTYAQRSGSYIKIGKLVIANAFFELSAKGSSTGGAVISGLPFNSGATGGELGGSGSIAYAAGLAGLTSPLALHLSFSSAAMSLYDWGATGVAVVDDTNFTNSSTLGLTISYVAA